MKRWLAAAAVLAVAGVGLARWSSGGRGARPAARADAPNLDTDAGGDQHTTGAILLPAEGESVSRGWLQLHVQLPPEVQARSVEAILDDAPATLVMAGFSGRQVAGAYGLLMLAELDARELAPGPHTLGVRWALQDSGEVQQDAVSFDVRGRAHRVRLRVRDEAGERVDARVFVSRDGKVLSMDQVDPDLYHKARDRQLRNQFAVNGELDLWLKPDTYTITAVRGVREELATVDVTVDGPETVDLTVPRVVSTPGWLAADLHVHTMRSRDATVPHRSRFASLAAGGLDAVVISDHLAAWDARTVYAQLGAAAPLMVIPGKELSIDAGEARGKKNLGHLNAFPMLDDEGTDLERRWPLDRNLARLRQRMPDAAGNLPGPYLLQLNHPRGIQFQLGGAVVSSAHALFTALGFDRDASPGRGPNAWMTYGPRGALDFDTLELANRSSWEIYLRVRRDWYALWRHGYTITATGNSDSHALHVELAGLPTNLVHVGAATGDDVLPAFLTSLREGRSVVSTGPVVMLELKGEGAPVGPGGTVTGREVVATVSVRAPSWVPVPEVRLLVNGREVASKRLRDGAGPVEGSWSFPLTLDEDAFVTAEAGWPPSVSRPKVPEPYATIAPGYVPFGLTNPVRVDVDGDGWTPLRVPRLAE